MRIAFVGDIHGRVLHLIALLLELQRTGHAIDRAIQVGDFGAYRDGAHLDPAAHRFVRDNPADLDFLRLLHPDDGLSLLLRHARAQLGAPVLFLRGNHEDHACPQRSAPPRRDRLSRADPARKDPTRRIQPGAVAIFDSASATLTPIGAADLTASLQAAVRECSPG